MMVNRARGEVPFVIDAATYRLCLTLGALAEIEAGLGLESLADLEPRLARPRSADLLVILTALLRGGGHDISEAWVARCQIDLKAAGHAIAASFAAAGFSEGGPPPGEAPAPQGPLSGGA